MLCTFSKTTSADSAILEGWKRQCARISCYFITQAVLMTHKTHIPYSRDLRSLRNFELLKPYFYNANLQPTNKVQHTVLYCSMLVSGGDGSMLMMMMMIFIIIVSVTIFFTDLVYITTVGPKKSTKFFTTTRFVFVDL